MKSSVDGTLEPLLRQIVPQLCKLAAACNPGLAAALADLREAATTDHTGTALQEAFSKLSQSLKTGAHAPSNKSGSALGSQTESPLNTGEGQLIRAVLQHMLVPVSLEALAQDIERALGRPADESGRQKLAAQLIHLLVESKAHAQRRQAELQEFLKATVGRLVQLETALNEAHSLNRQAGAEALQTRQITDAQFLQLRSVSSETDDLDQLKSFIGERLDHLQDHLRRQDTAGDRQHRRLEDHLGQLSQQVAQLSAETITLRSRLDVTTEEALRDPLTGAYNRLAYDRRAALEVARWRSDGGNLSMIVCDIDHFKRINDTFGPTRCSRKWCACCRNSCARRISWPVTAARNSW